MIRVDIGNSAELIEVTTHRHHPKVLGGELDLRVIRVQLPVAHGEPPCSPLGLEAAPDVPPGAIVAAGTITGQTASVGTMPDDEADLSSSRGAASPDRRVHPRRVLERLDEPECMALLADRGLAGWSSPADINPLRCRSCTRWTENQSSWARETASLTRTCAPVLRTP